MSRNLADTICRKYQVPESIQINGYEIHFQKMDTAAKINDYLDMIEKLQRYDSNVIPARK